MDFVENHQYSLVTNISLFQTNNMEKFCFDDKIKQKQYTKLPLFRYKNEFHL